MNLGSDSASGSEESNSSEALDSDEYPVASSSSSIESLENDIFSLESSSDSREDGKSIASTESGDGSGSVSTEFGDGSESGEDSNSGEVSGSGEDSYSGEVSGSAEDSYSRESSRSGEDSDSGIDSSSGEGSESGDSNATGEDYDISGEGINSGEGWNTEEYIDYTDGNSSEEGGSLLSDFINSEEDSSEEDLREILNQLHQIFVENNTSVELTPGAIEIPDNLTISDILQYFIDELTAPDNLNGSEANNTLVLAHERENTTATTRRPSTEAARVTPRVADKFTFTIPTFGTRTTMKTTESFGTESPITHKFKPHKPTASTLSDFDHPVTVKVSKTYLSYIFYSCV